MILMNLGAGVIKFNGLSRTADSEVHVVHISRAGDTYIWNTLEIWNYKIWFL